jgi:hypothetical protein
LLETANEKTTDHQLRSVFPRAGVAAAANRGFHWLPDAKRAAPLSIATRKRCTHFTIEQLIDARVAPEVIDLYQPARRSVVGQRAKAMAKVSSSDDDLLPGSISRLNTLFRNGRR